MSPDQTSPILDPLQDQLPRVCLQEHDCDDILINEEQALHLNTCGLSLFRLPIQVTTRTGKQVRTAALLDTGADQIYISKRLARKLPGTSHSPIGKRVILPDGRIIRTNIVAKCKIRTQTFQDTVTAYVLDIPEYNLILGLQWFKKWNPQIDWITGSVTIQEPRNSQDFIYKLQCNTSPSSLKDPKLELQEPY